MTIVHAPFKQVNPLPVEGRRGGHTAWCARDQRCGLGEHRSEPVLIRGRAASAVLIRVADSTGQEHVSVTLSTPLPANRDSAELTLSVLLQDLRQLVSQLR